MIVLFKIERPGADHGLSMTSLFQELAKGTTFEDTVEENGPRKPIDQNT